MNHPDRVVVSRVLDRQSAEQVGGPSPGGLAGGVQVLMAGQGLVGGPGRQVAEQHRIEVRCELVGSVDQQADRLVLGCEPCRHGGLGRLPTTPTRPRDRPGQPAHLLDGDPAAVGDAHDVLVAHERVGVFGHECHGLGGGQRPTLHRVEVAPPQCPVDPELEERTGLGDRTPQAVGVGSGHVTRVGTLGQCGDGEAQPELLLPGVDPLGRGLAGTVSVVGQDDPGGEAGQLAGVVGGHGGAAGGDGALDSRLVEADHIGVALAHDDLVHAARLGLGPVEAVEQASLVVDLGLVGGVLVLGALGVGQLAATEPDGVSPLVEDREHDAGPEEVVLLPSLVEASQPGPLEVLGRQVEMASQGVPLLGCPADRESAHDVAVIAACPQVAPGRPAVVTLEEAPVVEVGRLPNGLDERMPPTTLLGLVGVGVAECDVGLVGQVFDRPGEVQVLHLADKVDDVALHLTAEAVEDRLLLADRE